jgi:hypothetical protein
MVDTMTRGNEPGYPREAREIVIVDEAHRKVIHALFMACYGNLYSFHLRSKQWRLESDSWDWKTKRVTLREVLGEEKTAHAVPEDGILRGQWDHLPQ